MWNATNESKSNRVNKILKMPIFLCYNAFHCWQKSNTNNNYNNYLMKKDKSKSGRRRRWNCNLFNINVVFNRISWNARDIFMAGVAVHT